MNNNISVKDALDMVSRASWYHSFEVIPGVLTPGKRFIDANAILNDRYNLPHNLEGMKALDIGALDGPYTFELERRGAEVVAIDIQDPNHTGFNTAKSIRRSKAQYVQGNVYELSKLIDGKFDLILFFGVWYHLKHPLVAFNEIWKLLSSDGVLLLEGECLRNYVELPDGKGENPSELVRAMAESSIPITLFYSDKYKGDKYSWFIPNLACIREWLHASGFELTSHGFWDSHPHQRMFGTAKKNLNYEIVVDNPVW
jgi:SAM-dependent methyltransferase